MIWYICILRNIYRNKVNTSFTLHNYHFVVVVAVVVRVRTLKFYSHFLVKKKKIEHLTQNTINKP